MRCELASRSFADCLDQSRFVQLQFALSAKERVYPPTGMLCSARKKKQEHRPARRRSCYESMLVKKTWQILIAKFGSSWMKWADEVRRKYNTPVRSSKRRDLWRFVLRAVLFWSVSLTLGWCPLSIDLWLVARFWPLQGDVFEFHLIACTVGFHFWTLFRAGLPPRWLGLLPSFVGAFCREIPILAGGIGVARVWVLFFVVFVRFDWRQLLCQWHCISRDWTWCRTALGAKKEAKGLRNRGDDVLRLGFMSEKRKAWLEYIQINRECGASVWMEHRQSYDSPAAHKSFLLLGKSYGLRKRRRKISEEEILPCFHNEYRPAKVFDNRLMDDLLMYSFTIQMFTPAVVFVPLSWAPL